MDDHNHNATILTNNTQELLEARDAELRKVLKLKLILNEVRRLNLGPEQSSEVRRALKLTSVGDFVRLGDADRDQEHLLDLQDCSSCPPLSYTDRKAVRTKLTNNLRSTLTPIAEFGDKLRAELPEIFTKDAGLELSAEQRNIIRLEEQHRSNLEKLAELRSRKCALMKDAAELKMGPNLAHELKMQQAQAHLLQIKAELLRGYFINEIVSRSEHSLAAHKEVEKYIDELLSSEKQPPESGRR